MDNETPIRKPYEKPQATKLTLEQAKLKLLWHDAEGDEAANHLLRLLYPDLPSAIKKESQPD